MRPRWTGVCGNVTFGLGNRDTAQFCPKTAQASLWQWRRGSMGPCLRGQKPCKAICASHTPNLAGRTNQSQNRRKLGQRGNGGNPLSLQSRCEKPACDGACGDAFEHADAVCHLNRLVGGTRKREWLHHQSVCHASGGARNFYSANKCLTSPWVLSIIC